MDSSLIFNCFLIFGVSLIGGLAGLLLAGTGNVAAFLTGLTAGSFLYVATGDLLPEVFHTRERLWLKMGLLLLGIVIVGVLGLAH